MTMDVCFKCGKEHEEAFAKVRIDYPDTEDWESFELCPDCLIDLFNKEND
jgi:hypothetical protein